jgi:hypothetical protein
LITGQVAQRECYDVVAVKVLLRIKVDERSARHVEQPEELPSYADDEANSGVRTCLDQRSDHFADHALGLDCLVQAVDDQSQRCTSVIEAKQQVVDERRPGTVSVGVEPHAS